MLSPAFLAFALYFIVESQPTDIAGSTEDIPVYQFTAAILAIIAVAFAQLTPRFITREKSTLPMQRYVSMKIIQWALVEMAAIFIGITYFLTHQANMLVPMGILIAVIAFMRPTVDELMRYNVKG